MFLFVFSQVTSKPRVDIIEIQTIIKEVCGHTIKHGLEDSVLMESSRKLENGSFKFSYHFVEVDFAYRIYMYIYIYSILVCFEIVCIMTQRLL